MLRISGDSDDYPSILFLMLDPIDQMDPPMYDPFSARLWLMETVPSFIL